MCRLDVADPAHVHKSEIHIDFRIGSPALDVDGITAAGDYVPALRNGCWKIWRTPLSARHVGER